MNTVNLLTHVLSSFWVLQISQSRDRYKQIKPFSVLLFAGCEV